MANLGAIGLYIALVLSSYSVIGSLIGKSIGITALEESARRAIHVLLLVLFITTLSLVIAFINRDFQIAYVAAHSNLAMQNIYTWVAFYAGNEGSLLFIAFALSLLSSIAICLAPGRTKETLAYTVTVLMLVETFFLAVMIFMANPFETLPLTPSDGEGINPL